MTEDKLLRIHSEGIEVLDEGIYNKIKRGNLSASMANSFLSCPADWLLDKYIFPKIEHETPIHLTRGNAYHAIMENFFKLPPAERNPKSLAQMAAQVTENSYQTLFKDKANIDWIKDTVRGYLSMGIDYTDDLVSTVNLDGKEKLGLEMWVRAKFNTTRTFVGAVDKLSVVGNNTLLPRTVIQDWKTGATVHNYNPSKPVSEDNSFDYWRQQTLYAMALEQKGIHVDEASLVFPVAKEVVHVDWQNKDVQEHAIEDIQKLDSEYTKRINDNMFPFTPKRFCKWCDLLYKGRTVGKKTPPAINKKEFDSLVEYVEV